MKQFRCPWCSSLIDIETSIEDKGREHYVCEKCHKHYIVLITNDKVNQYYYEEPNF